MRDVTGYITGYMGLMCVARGFKEKSSQYRAVIKNRRALGERGISRFEVRGLGRDKALVRDLAKRLAVDDDAARALRSELNQKLAPQPEERGSVWRWLRSSPLVGCDWYIEREFSTGRKIDQ